MATLEQTATQYQPVTPTGTQWYLYAIEPTTRKEIPVEPFNLRASRQRFMGIQDKFLFEESELYNQDSFSNKPIEKGIIKYLREHGYERIILSKKAPSLKFYQNKFASPDVVSLLTLYVKDKTKELLKPLPCR